MKKGILSLMFIFVFFATFETAFAQGTVGGSIYDLSLEPAPDVLVEISTVPKQQVVSKDGTYSFEVGPGEYVITARQIRGGQVIGVASEDISVQGDGSYNIDLILFPSFEEEEQMLREIGGISMEDMVGEDQTLYYIVIGLLVVVIVFLGILGWKVFMLKPEKEPRLPEDLEKMVGIIKRSGGRATQKEIRKELNLSEAKISLMVSDLEDRGLARKVKKGRGNVVILNK